MIPVPDDTLLVVTAEVDPALNEAGEHTWYPGFALRTSMVRELEGVVTTECMVRQLIAAVITHVVLYPPATERRAWVADLMALRFEMEPLAELLLAGALRGQLQFESSGMDGWYRSEHFSIDPARIICRVPRPDITF